MNIETNGTATIAAPFQASPELVNGLLKWPEELRIELAKLLFDSVKEDFASLEEAELQDRDKIRGRIERAIHGDEPTYDAFEVIAEMRQRLAERRLGYWHSRLMDAM